jgi:repressor LexA
VAARAGIAKPYLSNIETGRAPNPPSDEVLRELERALQFKPNELRHMANYARTPAEVLQQLDALTAEVEKFRAQLGELPGHKKGKKIAPAPKRAGRSDNLSQGLVAGRLVPVVNRPTAGYPHHFTDLDYPPSVAEEYVRVPDVHDPQAFAARVVGDAMAPRYAEGDLVIFAPNRQPESGDDCFVRFSKDNSTTFRHVVLRDDRVCLQSLNGEYPAQECAADEIRGIWPAIVRIEKLR